jgi:mannobiose 2-epimerase
MDGTPVVRDSSILSTSDIGYKDQNSSIHLLEAFTELYSVWPDPLVRQRLQEMLFLLRDKIVTPKGYLTLFFTPEWAPISFRDSSKEAILQHRYLNHVSFGHDVETAYLMLEASHVLGLKNDTRTLTVAKRMVDSKNWWAQAEGMNTLLLMADKFPNDKMHYYQHFKKIWSYIQTYIIDHTYGDWYEEGLDKEPRRKTALKGHIWKATYHQSRALFNCVRRLRGEK